VRQMKLHACSFVLCSHDLHRQMEVHNFLSRLNQDVVQCVYDSDKPSARLIGARRRLFSILQELLFPICDNADSCPFLSALCCVSSRRGVHRVGRHLRGPAAGEAAAEALARV
jgi:hypothetical protein